jgi:hypothetical protein
MAALLGAVWGYGANTEPPANVIAISPAIAFNDAALTVSIVGGYFRPTYGFDTMAAAANTNVGTFSAALTPVGGSATDSIALAGVTWQSPKALVATVPAGVPEGRYDVTVTDPRGARMQLDGGFVSLGADTARPTVTVESPPAGTLVAAGTRVTVTLVAEDGAGFLQSMGATIAVMSSAAEMSCAVPAESHTVRCHYEFDAPAPTDENAEVIVMARATDTAGNDADVPWATFRLAPRPTLVAVAPTVGPAAGGTEIVVEGTDFIEPIAPSRGSDLLLDGQIIPSTWQSATEMRATLPHHDPGVAILTVANGSAVTEQMMYFEFIPAPILRAASPLSGPMTGGTPISITGNYFREGQTRISIGGAPLLCPHYVSPLRIDGYVPPASAPGPAIVVAADEIEQSSTLRATFVYEPAASDVPDPSPQPMNCGSGP